VENRPNILRIQSFRRNTLATKKHSKTKKNTLRPITSTKNQSPRRKNTTQHSNTNHLDERPETIIQRPIASTNSHEQKWKDQSPRRTAGQQIHSKPITSTKSHNGNIKTPTTSTNIQTKQTNQKQVASTTSHEQTRNAPIMSTHTSKNKPFKGQSLRRNTTSNHEKTNHGDEQPDN